MANDSDPDGDIIAVESISSQPTGGIATVEAGAIVYTPNETFAGTDRLTYALVDAGGEIAIGEVLVGVMPLTSENRAPEAFDDTVQAIAGSAPLVFDVLDNDSDPDGDRIRVTTVGDADDRRGRGRRGGRRRRVHTAGEAAASRRADVAFTYAIDDGRGGTAQATVDVEVIAAGEPSRPSPSTTSSARSPRPDRRDRSAGQRPRPRRQPGRARRRRDNPALADRDGCTVTIVAGPTSSRHVYTITDPDGLADTAEVDVLVVPNRAPLVQPHAVQTAANTPITIDLTAAGHRPRRRHPLLTCCDNPQGGAAHDGRERRRALTVSFDPDDDFAGLASFAYTVDDQQGHSVAGAVGRGAAAVEPPAGGRRHDPRRRGRHPADDRPRRARDRSRPERHADVHLDAARRPAP